MVGRRLRCQSFDAQQRIERLSRPAALTKVWQNNSSIIKCFIVPLKELVDLKQVKGRFRSLKRHLDERTRRLFAAAESEAIGRGGISAVSAATGISRRVIRQGKKELGRRAATKGGRLRQPGGGRKPALVEDPSLLVDLERLLEPATRGDPESALRWTCRSYAIWPGSCNDRVIKPATAR